MSTNRNQNQVYDLVIIGSGPAAFTAAIYAARANQNPILFEGEAGPDMTPGGQLTTTTDIENFPGFPDGINGFELVDNMKAQAIRFGTKVESKTIVDIDLTKKLSPNFLMRTNDGPLSAGITVEAKAVIVATGATAKKLNFTNSDKYWMLGISACAVCDGALPMFRNKPVAVIGGGDTAMEEATFLSKYASVVYIVHRSAKLRASKIMQERVLKNPKIQILYNYEVVEAIGNSKPGSKLEAIMIKSNLATSTSAASATSGASAASATSAATSNSTHVAGVTSVASTVTAPLAASSVNGEKTDKGKAKIIKKSAISSTQATQATQATQGAEVDHSMRKLEVSGLFYAIGHKPASDFLSNQVKLDAEGYIITEPGTTRTSVPGVFAAGDVQDHKWRQAITAAGTGCMAALEAEHYIANL